MLIIQIFGQGCLGSVNIGASLLSDDFQFGSYVLEPISGTKDFSFNVTREEKPWNDRSNHSSRCVRPAKCEKIQNATCFGAKIPYKFTSTSLTELGSQIDIRDALHNLEALRNVPKCWAVVQVSVTFRFSLRHFSFRKFPFFPAIFVRCLYAKM